MEFPEHESLVVNFQWVQDNYETRATVILTSLGLLPLGNVWGLPHFSKIFEDNLVFCDEPIDVFNPSKAIVLFPFSIHFCGIHLHHIF